MLSKDYHILIGESRPDDETGDRLLADGGTETASTDRDDLLVDVAESLEGAAVDLQNGNVEAAGYELRNAAHKIRREVQTDNDRSGGDGR